MVYQAPEILLGHEHYGIGVDIWALGCIFAELFLNNTLFQTKNRNKILWNIFKILGNPKAKNSSENKKIPSKLDLLPEFEGNGVGFIRHYHPDFDICAEHLLLRMLSLDHKDRPSCQMILKHPFFED